MHVSTRSASRAMNVAPIETPRASTSEVVSKTGRSKRATKQIRKVAEAPTVVHRGENPEDELMSPKWQAIFAEHPPLAVLPPEYLPHLSGGAHAPRFFFGWAFDKSSFLGVARRRRLTFTVNSYYRRRFGGLETFNFGDLTEDQVNNPALTEYLHSAAAIDVHSYILQQTRAHFTVEHMLSQRWAMMYALWTNYDIKQKYSVFKAVTDWEKVETFMDELLNECLPPDSERSEPLWWWSVDNRFVRP